LLDVSSRRTSISTHASHLVHLLDQSVDVLLSVTQVATLDVMLELPRSETTSGVAQLERPEEVTRLFEVRSDGGDLVDQVFHTDDAELAQGILDQLVVSEGDALLVDLAISALVDEFTDGLEVRVPVSDVWVNDGEHLLGGFGQADEDAVVYLKKTEELENLARFRGDLGDTVGWKGVLTSVVGEEADVTNPLIRMTKTSFGCSST
jgi:hypothetical protein